MKLPPPPPNDDETTGKPKGKPSYDPHFAAQQKHRRAEREAVGKAFAGYFSKPDPATLEMIRLRWDTGIINQIHIGKWASIWPVLDAARRVPGWCSKGLVVFGVWNASPPDDIDDVSPPPEDLLDLVISYGIYAATIDLVDWLNAAAKAGDAGEYTIRNARFKKWLANHRMHFPFRALCSEEADNAEDIAKTFANQSMNELPPIIRNLLVKLDDRVFIFLPSPEDPASGWRDFLAFMDGYSRLPGDIINGFNDYFFSIHVPGGI